jgi:type VI secretion system protein ImpL
VCPFIFRGQMKKAIFIAVPLLLLWLIFSWLVPGLLRLKPSDTLILRVALIAIGVVGTAAFLWLRLRAQSAEAGLSATSAAHDVDVVFAEAKSRLRAANYSKSRLSEIPALIILGDAGSAKTTLALRAGLDPELLAGQVFAGDVVAPTASVNIWLARDVLLLDTATAVLNDHAAWRALAKQLTPATATAFGKQPVEARAAVVCLSCEAFAEQNASESLARRAREIRQQLSDLAALLGVALPVYVFFTKMDKLRHFEEFVANLSDDEAKEVLGVTLPFAAPVAAAYADQQTKLLERAFSSIYAALCDKRVFYLEREHDPAKTPATYEFPREFAKIRPLLTQFLVDLCRPSQLQTNPVLRGFYFTGVRAVTVADVQWAPAAPAPSAAPFDPAATRVFLQPPRSAQEGFQPRSSGRRVPQWVYLPRVFPEVLLADRAALHVSKSTVNTSVARRAVFAALAIVGLLLAAAWTVSFAANYQLVNEAKRVAGALDIPQSAADPASPANFPTQSSMDRLGELRNMAATLSDYQSNGSPAYMHLDLYTGDALLPPVHHAWCTAFESMLLQPTQAELVRLLSNPANSATNDGYVYSGLKAYLITTSFPEKSTGSFLSEALLEHWRAGTAPPVPLVAAADREFKFYAAELAQKRFCSTTEPNAQAVASSRKYLQTRSSGEPVYKEILAKVNAEPPLVFDTLYPDSVAVVGNRYPVPHAFTKAGWARVQSEIETATKYLAGDEWVLGRDNRKPVDPVALKLQLLSLYRADLVKHWRAYLQQTSITKFANVKDAADKLRLLSNNQSPLLKVLCLASENTTLEDKGVADTFQPPQSLAPAGCTNHWSSKANDSYMNGLIALQASLATLSTDESNEALRGDALSKATNAAQIVSGIAHNFTPEGRNGVDSATAGIIEAPITYVQVLLAGVPKQQLNGAARGFCAQFGALMRKYPFYASNAAAPATIDEFEQIFKPGTGALFKLVQENLQKSVMLLGSTFEAKPEASPAPSRAFLNFLNQAGAVSNAFYHGGQQLQVAYGMRIISSEDVQSVALTMGGQTMNYSKGNETTQRFVWTGSGPQDVKMRVKFAGGSDFDYPSYSGTWAIFKFFGDSQQWGRAGIDYVFEKPLTTIGGVFTVPATGHPATVRLALDTGGAPAVLKPGYFGGLSCVSVATQ